MDTNTVLCSCVSADERFPEYGKVEFVFSYGPEKIKGNVTVQCDSSEQSKTMLLSFIISDSPLLLARPGPPGERAQRVSGLQHGRPADPLGLL